jgi:hypothetical protein
MPIHAAENVDMLLVSSRVFVFCRINKNLSRSMVGLYLPYTSHEKRPGIGYSDARDFYIKKDP